VSACVSVCQRVSVCVCVCVCVCATGPAHQGLVQWCDIACVCVCCQVTRALLCVRSCANERMVCCCVPSLFARHPCVPCDCCRQSATTRSIGIDTPVTCLCALRRSHFCSTAHVCACVCVALGYGVSRSFHCGPEPGALAVRWRAHSGCVLRGSALDVCWGRHCCNWGGSAAGDMQGYVCGMNDCRRGAAGCFKASQGATRTLCGVWGGCCTRTRACVHTCTRAHTHAHVCMCDD
jgi:hypothetical protein